MGKKKKARFGRHEGLIGRVENTRVVETKECGPCMRTKKAIKADLKRAEILLDELCFIFDNVSIDWEERNRCIGNQAMEVWMYKKELAGVRALESK